MLSLKITLRCDFRRPRVLRGQRPNPIQGLIEQVGCCDPRPRAGPDLAVRDGNLGDHKEVGGGVWEARLDFGPGYRLYFGRSGRELLLLLTGGDKKSQTKDIKRAREFWSQYVKELRHGKA